MFTASLGVFLFGLLAAIAGGAVGAAIGGNYAFVLTGFCVLASWGVFAATGNSFGFDYISFGPFMGPHIAFAGGAAAAVYARYKGYMEDGKDVNSPLAGLGRPDVIYVGSIFGIFGYIVQIGISKIPWFGGHTDSVADDDHNQKLSEDRAKAVRSYVAPKVSGVSIEVEGKGENEPAASETNEDGSPNEAGKAANRRVVIVSK